MKALKYITLLVLGIIAVFSFTGYPEPSLLNNLILAITAVAVLWYADETSRLRSAMVKQNKLQTRPIIIPDLTDKKIFLRNQGIGPGLNIKLREFEAFSTRQGDTDPEPKEPGKCYRMTPITFLPHAAKAELEIFCDDLTVGTKGTVPDCGACFQEGKIVKLTIGYEDIEGTAYQSRIMIRAGTCINMKFEEIR